MSGKKNDKKYLTGGITPKKILAYLETKAGKPQVKIGKELGVCQKTISNWTGEIEEYIKQCPEYQQAPSQIAEMIPGAFQVYRNKLALDDLSAARDVLKMAVIFIERKQVESSNSNKSDDDLWAELMGLVNDESDTEPDSAREEADGEHNRGVELPEAE